MIYGTLFVRTAVTKRQGYVSITIFLLKLPLVCLSSITINAVSIFPASNFINYLAKVAKMLKIWSTLNWVLNYCN